jgi:hypothetical protein
VVQHGVYGLKVFFGFVVQLLRLVLELLEAPLGVDVDGIFGIVADVELGLELLRCLFASASRYVSLRRKISTTQKAFPQLLHSIKYREPASLRPSQSTQCRKTSQLPQTRHPREFRAPHDANRHTEHQSSLVGAA